MKRYISVIALTEDLEDVVLLQKTKGPEHLIGKWIIPGGGLEESDVSLQHAAAREFKEETGCDIPAEKMIPFCRKGSDMFQLDVFFAVGDVRSAKQQPNEVEPIEVRNWARVRAEIAAGDASYADDFVDIVRALDNSAAVTDAIRQASEAHDQAVQSERKRRISP